MLLSNTFILRLELIRSFSRGIMNGQVHELDAAVMVVDVSGFSRMSERFDKGLVPDGGWMQKKTVRLCCFYR